MALCVNCTSQTNYICLSCNKAICNKSAECSVPADEETPGWKMGISVAFCLPCSKHHQGSDNLGGQGSTKRPLAKETKSPAVSRNAKVPSTLSKEPTAGRKCLTLREKIEVIQLSGTGGISTRKLADRFGCGKTQITKALKNKQKIMSEWNSYESSSTQKRSNNEKFSNVNQLLWEWYVRARESNIPVSGPLLVEEAKLIAESLGEGNFKGTNGWLQKWKRRHNITEMSIAGEEGDVSAETVESWQERVKEITRGYTPQDVWNQDETGSFWKALPEKSLSERGKRCRGGKNSMQRVTIAFFVNAAGGKESPVLIGKSKKPRCFSKLKDASRPCGAHYFSNDKAWMRTEIMIDILTKLNTRMKREGRNILMFLDNAPCHPPKLKGMFSNIRVEFLPKNTTSRTQPLDAGIIKTWKVYYRRKLLRYVASQIDVKQCASDIIKSVNLLMAVRWMVSAWEEVKPEVIIKCFKHVGMHPEENHAEEDDDPFAGEELLDLNELVAKVSGEKNVDAATYVTDADCEALSHEPFVDTGDPNWRRNLRTEIIESHTSTETMQIDDEGDSEDMDRPLSRPEVDSVKDALRLAKQLVEFADWRGEEQLSLAIGRAHDLLCDLQLKSCKQSSLDSFVVKM